MMLRLKTFLNSPTLKYSFVAVVSAIVSALATTIPTFWYASIIGTSLFLHTLTRLQTSSRRRLFLQGMLFGTVYLAVSNRWMWDTYPLEFLHLPTHSTAFIFIAVIWLSTSILVSLPIGMFALALRYSINVSAWQKSLFLASTWILAEYLQMLIYTILSLGPESAWIPHYSLTLLGYSAAWFSPILQLAQIGGVYLLSGALILLAIGLQRHAFARDKRHSVAVTYIVFTCFSATATYIDARYPIVDILIPSQPHTQKLHVAVVTTFASRADKPDLSAFKDWHQTQLSLIQSLSTTTPPDIILFPETSNFMSFEPTTTRAELTKQFGKKIPVIVDNDRPHIDATKTVDRIEVYTSLDTPPQTYDKIYLDPGGEYTPYAFWLAISPYLLFHPTATHNLNSVAGTSLSPFYIASTSIGTLICSDVISPSLFAALTTKGAEILFTSSSDAWFHRSIAIDRYMIALSKVRAVESNRYLVNASNYSSSFIISNTGVLTYQSPVGEYIYDTNVPTYSSKTIYSKTRTGILLIPLLFCIAIIAQERRKTLHR